MLVSIIIPSYNSKKFIEQTVESALGQTYKDIEVIIIDDKSTDGSDKFVHKKYAGRVRFCFRKKNGGTAAALNSGIKMAKGDWIKWVSSDDVLYPYSVERMIKFIKKNITKDAQRNSIFYTNYRVIDQNGKFLHDFIEPDHPTQYLWQRFFGNGSSTLIHKNVFKKCGMFDECMPHSEDYEFWLRATQIYGIQMILIPEFLLMYRKHPDMLTNKVGGSLDAVIKEKIREAKSASG